MSKGLEILFPYVLLNLFVFLATKNVLYTKTRYNKSFNKIVGQNVSNRNAFCSDYELRCGEIDENLFDEI